MNRTFHLIAGGLGFLVLSGCATMPPGPPPPMPTRLMPQAPPDNQQTLKAIKGGTVELGSGPYFTVLKATLNDHVIFLRVLFSNQGKKPVTFGPESISLADATGTLVRALSPADVVQPYVNQVQNTQAQALAAAANAQAAEEQAEQYNHQLDRERRDRQRNGQDQSDLEKAAEAVGVFSNTLSVIGAESAASHASSDAQAAQQALATFDERVHVGTLQSQPVPPGTKAQGIACFAEPAQWPVTLRILLEGRTLAVTLSSSSSRSLSPQVAASRLDYLKGLTTADYPTQAANLRRSDLMNGIYMQAMPLTPAVVEAREKWNGFKYSLSQDEVRNHVQSAVAELQPDQSEFDISLGAYDPRWLDPSAWQATLMDSGLKEYPVTLTPMPAANPPSYVTAYYRTKLRGRAQKIDFAAPFQLTLRHNHPIATETLNVAWQQQVAGSTVPVTLPLLKSNPDPSGQTPQH